MVSEIWRGSWEKDGRHRKREWIIHGFFFDLWRRSKGVVSLVFHTTTTWFFLLLFPRFFGLFFFFFGGGGVLIHKLAQKWQL